DRLFEPAWPVWREPPTEVDRGVRRKSAVHLDEELGIRADRFPDGGDNVHRTLLIGFGHFVGAAAEWINLERSITHRDDVSGSSRDCVRSALDLIPAIRVCRNDVAALPAEQSPDGNA